MNDLERMLEELHQRYLARARTSASEALRFQRLSQRLAEAVGAQAELVDRMSRTVNPRQPAARQGGVRELCLDRTRQWSEKA